jgi:hypothetical protein
MSFDEEARLSAEALGTHLSREIQERLQEFIGRLVDAAEQERQATADKAAEAQAVAVRLHREATERAQQEQQAAVDRVDLALAAAAHERQELTDQAREALAAAERTLQEAVARAREDAFTEASARFDAELAERTARFGGEHAQQLARVREDATAEATSRFEAELADRTARFDAEHGDRIARARDEALAEATSRFDAEHGDRLTRAREEAAAEATARLEADHADHLARVRADALAEATSRVQVEHSDRLARARDEALVDATSRFEAEHGDRLSRARDEAAAEATARLEAEHADRMARVLEDARAEATTRFESEQHDRVARAREHALAEATARFEAELAKRTAQFAAEHADRLARAEADRADRDAASDRDAIERQTSERETLVAGVHRLVAGFRRLDEGQSLSQLLDTLGTQAAAEAARCALFVVRGRSLQGWSLSGFDGAPGDARTLSIGLDVVPELARVVAKGQRAEIPTATFATEEAEALGFINLASVDVGVAVPVTVGGQVAAVVYVDDGGREDRPVPASWPEAIELLARHAGRCLEAQTAIRAARLSQTSGGAPPQPLRAVPNVSAPAPAAADVPPVQVAALTPTPAPLPTVPVMAPAGMNDAYAEEHARRYARLLIADIRLYNEAAVRTGREQRDLAQRLQPEIARARHAFEQRVPASVAERERFFDEELVRTLADGDEALLGPESHGSHEERVAV